MFKQNQCGSILNWLGIEDYPVYDNLPISEDDKKDHNQNTRVCEHLLKELTDTTSLADMLCMATVCEGTVHSEEISKQYLESVKTVKQIDAIHHQWNNSKNKHKGKSRGHRTQSHHQSHSHKPGSCNNCRSSHPPKKCKAYGKECFNCHKQGHFSQFCHSKQCGKSLGSSVRSSSQKNRYSHCDVHEIDQSQFDDSVQFEQDSITIQFGTQ